MIDAAGNGDGPEPAAPPPDGVRVVAPLAIVLLGLGAGMVCGAIEAGWRYSLEQRASWDFTTYYMLVAPLADAAVIGLVGGVLAAAALVWKRLRDLRVVASLAGFAVFWTFLDLFDWLHDLAALVLAAGLCSVALRVVDRTRTATLRRAAWMVAGCTLLIVLSCAGVLYLERRATGRRLTELRGTARAGAPNVIVVTLDTVRAANLSLYGYERKTTPELDRIGRMGIVFDDAYATTSWTLPTHASMFTGRFAFETGTDWYVPLGDGFPTLAERLLAGGYATVGVVANLDYCCWRSGLRRGFVDYHDYFITPRAILNCTRLGKRFLRAVRRSGRTLKPAERVNEELFSWLRSSDRDRPFFAFLNYYDAHDPYLAPPPFARQFRGRGVARPSLASVRDRMPARAVRQMDRYDRAITYVDAQVGAMFDEIERLGLLDDTLFVITSDHGEAFGEHGLTTHGNSLYVETLHVPLIAVWRGHVPAGLRVRHPVTLRDLAATVLDLTGLGDGSIPGVSWRRLWDRTATRDGAASPVILDLVAGKRVPRDYRNFGGAVRSLIRDRLHPIRHDDPELGDELYDLEADPFEQVNRADSPELGETVSSMIEELESVFGTAR